MRKHKKVCYTLEKSVVDIIEKRSYFENGKLIYQINNEDNASPMSNKILNDEQAEIETNFKRVLKIRNEE